MAVIDFGNEKLYAGVTEDFPFSVPLFESDDSTPAEFAADDVVYCVLSSRTKGEPIAALLTIQSDEATDNDSRVCIDPDEFPGTSLGNADTGAPAVGFVRFAQDDTAALVAAWPAGVYQMLLVCELWYVDASEANPANAKKLFARGEILLHRTGAL